MAGGGATGGGGADSLLPDLPGLARHRGLSSSSLLLSSLESSDTQVYEP